MMDRYGELWLSDNELYGEDGELNQLITSLGKEWKLLLKKTDAQLGIDPEFSRPAIEALLDRFAETVEENGPGEDTSSFKWK
jgi:hypothetical protein